MQPFITGPHRVAQPNSAKKMKNILPFELLVFTL
jgi:hypothetical protein